MSWPIAGRSSLGTLRIPRMISVSSPGTSEDAHADRLDLLVGGGIGQLGHRAIFDFLELFSHFGYLPRRSWLPKHPHLICTTPEA